MRKKPAYIARTKDFIVLLNTENRGDYYSIALVLL
jgi:hypothetical protein